MADRAPAIALGQHLLFHERTWTVVAVSGTTVTLRASTGQLSAVLVTHLMAAAAPTSTGRHDDVFTSVGATLSAASRALRLPLGARSTRDEQLVDGQLLLG